jgi:hypothetical protein
MQFHEVKVTGNLTSKPSVKRVGFVGLQEAGFAYDSGHHRIFSFCGIGLSFVSMLMTQKLFVGTFSSRSYSEQRQ